MYSLHELNSLSLRNESNNEILLKLNTTYLNELLQSNNNNTEFLNNLTETNQVTSKDMEIDRYLLNIYKINTKYDLKVNFLLNYFYIYCYLN
jgi:hypothetical protein